VNGNPHPPPACVSLDAAGTLFYLRKLVGHTYAEIAAAYGIPLEGDAVTKSFRAAWKALPPPLQPEGQPSADDDRSWWRSIVGHTLRGATTSEVAEPALDDFFHDLYQHFASADAWQLYHDTIPALDLLRPHCRLFVTSNFDLRLLPILKGLGIRDYFEEVIISSQVGAYKPHPRIFQRLLTATAVPATEMVHVGDDERCDLEGAQASGIPALLLSRPEVTLLTAAEKILTGGISHLHPAIS